MRLYWGQSSKDEAMRERLTWKIASTQGFQTGIKPKRLSEPRTFDDELGRSARSALEYRRGVLYARTRTYTHVAKEL